MTAARRRKNGYVLLLTLIGMTLGFLGQAFAMTLEDLDSTRRVDWKSAGYPGQIPDINVNIVNVKDQGAKGDGVTDDHGVIQSAIDSAGDPAVIYFPQGTYRLESALNLKSGVVLRGAGSETTRLEYFSNNGCMEIAGTVNGSYQAIERGLEKDSEEITVSDPTVFQIGHGGEIRQEDINAVDPENKWGPDQGWEPTHVMGQMVKIVKIDGRKVTIEPPLHISFNADKNPEIRPVTYIERVGIEDLTIKRIDRGNITHNLNITWAADCWFRRIESDQTQQYHFHISKSLHLEIRGCYIHDAYHKGGGGQGYGVSLNSYVTSVLVEDNIFSDLRHSMSVQLGTNGSVFGYNYSQRNYSHQDKAMTHISVHGHYPYMNLFEGNIVGYAGLADWWGASGPGNTLLRNRMIGTDGYKDFGPHRGISVDDHSHRQNIIGNELTGSETRISFDGHDDMEQGSSNDLIVHGNNVHGTIDWDPLFGDQALPASFYRLERPAFFEELPWPAMGPDIALNTGTIPALKRYNSENYVVQPGNRNQRPSAPKNLQVD